MGLSTKASSTVKYASGFFFILVAISVALLSGFEFWPQNQKADSQAVLVGASDRVTGQVYSKSPNSELHYLTGVQAIHDQDLLISDINSVLIFHLKSGSSFELKPQSKILIQKISAQAKSEKEYSLSIIEGQLVLLSEQNTDKFEVSKDGHILSIDELKNKGSIPTLNIQNTKNNTLDIPNQKSDETIVLQKSKKEDSPKIGSKTSTQKTESATNSLSNEDIHRVMRTQTSFLHRCFINYKIKNKQLELKGQFILSFVIFPSGKVKNTKVVQSPYPDDQLEKCIADVIDRAQFKEFSGQEIGVEAYPLDIL